MNNNNSPCGISLNGKVRRHNEDSFLYTNEQNWKNQLAIVADGIGGNAHGEIASRLCCQYFLETWEKSKAMDIEDVKSMEKFMFETLQEVNSRIFQLNCKSDFVESPMGSTIVAAAIMPKDIVVVHAGDSRFYEFRDNGKLTCLTEDHSFLQRNKDLLANSALQNFGPSELGNLITKSVGTTKRIEDNEPNAPILNTVKRRANSRYMLCSDGLTHMVEDERIITILSNSSNNSQAVNKLVAAAFSNGAIDNISIIIY